MAQVETVFGIHALTALVERAPERMLELFVAKGREDDKVHYIVNQARRFGISVQFVQRKVLDDKAQSPQHQGVLARVQAAPTLNEGDLDQLLQTTEQPFLLVLDGVTDPHNLGAVLRTADAAGVDGVIVTKDKAVSLNATVRKVACGAAEVVPLFQVTNLARTLRELQDNHVWVIGTAGEAEQVIYEVNMPAAVALVMGAEGSGMRRLTRETCDELIKLPMLGSVSSLNVSVATGICLYEIMRQRQLS